MLMKYLNFKLLIFFAALALAIPPAWAGTETVVFSEQGYNNGQGITSYNGSTFSLSFADGGNSNVPKYLDTGAAIRLYAKNSMTVTSDYTITKIELTFSSGENTNAITTNVGNYSDGTWTGSANSVKFTVGGSSGHRRVASVTVTTEGGSSPTTVTLSFSETSCTAMMNQAFTAPTLSIDPPEAVGEVVYSSSNTSVATVDADDGTVTLVGAGTTMISASFTGNENYTNANASYTLTVSPDPNVVAVLDFTNPNLWNPSLPLGSGNITVGPAFYDDGTYEVKIAGSPGFYYYSSAHDLLLGKQDAYLQFPAFNKPVERIVIEGAPSGATASGKVTQNIFVGETAVSTETTSAKENHTYEIAPGYQSAGTIYTLRVTNDNNTQFQKIYIYFKEETGEPELTLTPPELNIGEAGGTLTVNGSNLGSDPGVFLINETGYSDQFDFALQGVDEGQTWFPRTNGAVTNGKVDVTYTGHELIAQGKIGVNSNNTGNGASSIVYYKVDDIYIVGDYGIDEGWNFTDGTNRMSNNGGIFTYELNVNNTNTFIAFAKKVGEGVGFNTPSVFTPSSGGNWEMDADTKSGTINVYGAQPIHFQYAGLYAIEINTNNNPATFTITRTLPQVEKPKISPNGGNFAASQTVTLSCDTEGAAIYYTTDESEPSAENGTLYEGEFTLNATTTLKAIAVKDGMRPSEVATATFTKTGIDNLAGVIALGKNKNFTFAGEVVVTHVGTYGTNKLIGLRDMSQNKADGNGGCVFFNTPADVDLKAGDILTPGWTGHTTQYGANWIEITNAGGVTTSGTAEEVMPFDRTGVELTSANQSEYIILRNVTIDADENTATWTDANAKVTRTYDLYNRFDGVTYDSGNYEYLIGLVSAFKATPQVYPIELKKVPQVATPTITPNGGEFTAAQDVTFSCATEGATILYSLDGVNWTEGTTLTVDRSGKVYAKATKANMQDSEVAEATFTINYAPISITLDPETETYTVGDEAKVEVTVDRKSVV